MAPMSETPAVITTATTTIVSMSVNPRILLKGCDIEHMAGYRDPRKGCVGVSGLCYVDGVGASRRKVPEIRCAAGRAGHRFAVAGPRERHGGPRHERACVILHRHEQHV